MIVRLMGEGQFQLDEALLDRLQELDDAATRALEAGDEPELDRCLTEMAALVRSEGTPLPDTELAASEIVLPPADLTLEETRRLATDEGFIPGPSRR